MNPVSIVAGFLSGFINYLQAKRVQGEIRDAFDMVEAVNNWVGRVITAIADTMGQEQGAMKYSAQYAQKIGSDLEQIQGSHQAAWNRFIDTILPNTFSHAYKVTQQWAIDYFSPPITDLYNHVQSLDTSRTEDEGTLYRSVVPNVSSLLQFRTDFFRGDQPAIDVLNDWLARPADFGAWAAAPIIGPIVAYLAYQGHAQSRDNLARIMVDAWSEVPNDVWESILRWSVTSK